MEPAPDPEPSQDGFGHSDRLVGAQHEPAAPRPQLLQHPFGTGEQTGLQGHAFGIEFQEPDAQVRTPGPVEPSGSTESAPDKRRRSVPDQGPHLRQREGGAPALDQKGVEGAGEIGGTVDQGAVEIEGDRARYRRYAHRRTPSRAGSRPPGVYTSHVRIVHTVCVRSLGGPAMAARPLAAAILAGGAGRRMGSRRPKPLQPIASRPAILHVLAAAAELAPAATVVVHGPDAEALVTAVRTAAPETRFALQPEPRGTGDAAEIAVAALGGFRGDLVILCADVPLLAPATLQRLRRRLQEADRPALAVLGFRPDHPAGYGRLRLREDGYVDSIVEEQDADDDARAGGLCNAGALAADAARLAPWLRKLGTDNAAGERLLTEAVALAGAAGERVAWVEGPAADLAGINTRAELAACEAVLQARLRRRALETGAILVDPATTWLAWDTVLAADVRVEPQVFFGPAVRVDAGTEILAFCHIEGSVVGKDCRIGPFARLRAGTRLGDRVRVGNFVEIKDAVLEADAKAGHLAYVGDGTVGAEANIGAGTIFCNFDGTRKHRTTIGPGAFIGSNSALVAPVRVGRHAIVGAGSTITRDVPDAALAVERAATRVRPSAGRARRPHRRD